MSKVMLFPLGSVILPEGKMRLRIFEPRYKRLVAEATKADGTFGICLFEKNSNGENELSEHGTLVQIVDFDSLEDGMLGITVVGIKRFKIEKVRTEFDGLRTAQVNWSPSWPIAEFEPKERYISNQLQNLYIQFPELGDLYNERFFDDASWVCQRWLEILPLHKQQFDQIYGQDDCELALHFLSTAIESEKSQH